MSDALRFRPLSEDDLEPIAALERELHAAPWTLGNFRDALAAGYGCTVGWIGAERVCYGVVMVGAGEAQILNVSVAPARQRQGWGQALVAELLRQAARLDVHEAFLEVRASNVAAIALYRRLGFEAVGRRKEYYPPSPGRGREDAIVMRLPITRAA